MLIDLQEKRKRILIENHSYASGDEFHKWIILTKNLEAMTKILLEGFHWS